MNDSAKFRVTFAVTERWSAERDKANRARIGSGSSSVRVSKATLARLRAMASRISELHPSRYYRASLSLDELLYLVADGVLQVKRPTKAKAAK